MIGDMVLATPTQALFEPAASSFVVALVIRHHPQVANQRQTPEKIAGPGVRLLRGLKKLSRMGKISPFEQDVGGKMEVIG